MCGEKPRVAGNQPLPLGSPPRVRGKVVYDETVLDTCGITPACAGKRSRRGSRNASRRDHPRVCGEKLRLRRVSSRWQGSPPRVRGKVCFVERHEKAGGITPACAGKRWRCARSATTSRDHPRVCGEKCSADFSHERDQGSPPRVRGKAPDGISTGLHAGITPACAGKRGGLSTIPAAA